MNTGIVDAVVLGRLLADVVKGKRPESALGSYEELRRPAATKVLGLAGMLTNMATIRSAPKRLLRNAVLSLINILPPAKRRLQINLSGLARKNWPSAAVIEALSRDVRNPVAPFALGAVQRLVGALEEIVDLVAGARKR